MKERRKENTPVDIERRKPGRPAKGANARQRTVLSFAVTEVEADRILSAARKHDLSVSQYLRLKFGLPSSFVIT